MTNQLFHRFGGGLRDSLRSPRRGSRGRSLLAALGVLVFAGSAWAAEIVDVRVGRHPTFTRVVFELDRAAGYRIERSDPSRGRSELIVSLEAFSDPQTIKKSRMLIRQVDVEPMGSRSVARVQLAQDGLRLKEMILANPPRIVLDLVDERAKAPTVAKKAAPSPKASSTGSASREDADFDAVVAGIEPDAVAAKQRAAEAAAKAKAEAEAKAAAEAAEVKRLAEAKAAEEAAEAERLAEAKAAEERKKARQAAKEERRAAKAAKAKAEAERLAAEEAAREAERLAAAEAAEAEAAMKAAEAKAREELAAAEAEAARLAEAAKTEAANAAQATADVVSDAGDAAGEAMAAAAATAQDAVGDAGEAVTNLAANAEGAATHAAEAVADAIPGARPIGEAKKKAEAQPRKPRPMVAKTTKDEEGSGWLTWALAGGGLLLALAGGGWMLARRRGEGGDDEWTSDEAGDDVFGDANPLATADESADPMTGTGDVSAEAAVFGTNEESMTSVATQDEEKESESVVFDAEENDMDDMEVISRDQVNESLGAPAMPPVAGGVSDDMQQMFAEMTRRMEALEARCDELVDARDRLERQVAAQTEELRVQRAAIARTQRAVRNLGRGEAEGEEQEATEPALRDPNQPTS